MLEEEEEGEDENCSLIILRLPAEEEEIEEEEEEEGDEAVGGRGCLERSGFVDVPEEEEEEEGAKGGSVTPDVLKFGSRESDLRKSKRMDLD